MNRRDRICKCCGHNDVEYRHRLNGSLVRAMAACFRAAGATPFKPSLVDQLDHSQKCNFASLKYWGFIEKFRFENNNKEFWRITDRGQRFLFGEISAPLFLWSWRGELAQLNPSEAPAPQVLARAMLKDHEMPSRPAMAAAARAPQVEAQQALF